MVRLLVILLIFTISSCSQKKESSVRFEISNNFIFGGPETATIAGGGLMVWGKSDSGGSFARVIVDSDATSLQLVNGVWVFWAMAWDGKIDYINSISATNFPFGGKTRCAKSAPIALAGGDVGVSLDLTNAQCALPAFKGPDPASMVPVGPDLELPRVKMRFCDSISNVQGPTDRCTDLLSDSDRKGRKAPVSSFRVVLNNHFSLGPLHKIEAGGLISPCISFSGTAAELDAQLTGTNLIRFPSLPVGGGDLPFHTTVLAYIGDESCDSTTRRGPIAITMPNGIGRPSPGHKYFATGNDHVMALNIAPGMICEGRRGTNLGGHPFAGGKGNPTNPFIICSVPQLFAINDDAANLSKSYKLQDHLDFRPFAKGLTGLPLPPNHACLDLGSNFLPLGYTSPDTSCPAGSTMIWPVAPTSFMGKFFGAGFSLRNMKFRAGNKDRVGLFASLNYNGSVPTTIQELEFQNPSLDGSCRVGVLAGESIGSNSSSIILSDIKIQSASINSVSELAICSTNSYAGTLTGFMNHGSLIRNIIQNSKVISARNYVGGAVGRASDVIFERVSVEADVSSFPKELESNYIGGIAGQVGVASSLDWVKHEGQVYAKGSQVGGIAGELSNLTSFRNYYSISSVVNLSDSTLTNTGGVVGYWSSGDIPHGPGYNLSMVTLKTSGTAGIFSGGFSGAKPVGGNQGSIYRIAIDDNHLRNFTSPAAFNNESSNTLTLNQFYQGTATSMAALSDPEWVHALNTYPRFAFEKHPCGLGIAGTGDGTLSSPKLICNDQNYFAIGSGLGDTVYKLISNIRLPNNDSSQVAQYDIPEFKGILEGSNHALIGGHRRHTTSAALSGHILKLTGTIRNLKIFNMSWEGDGQNNENYPAGLFVGENLGNLENIIVTGFPDFWDSGAGIVGRNSGRILRATFNGRVAGKDNLAGLAVVNQGVIEDSTMDGELYCKEGAGCNYLSGLVKKNSGKIARVEMGGRLVEQAASPSYYTSMVANENTASGVIEDILISDKAYFAPSGTDHYFFTRINQGSVTRAINRGRLIHQDSTHTSPMLIGWPVVANPDAGTYTDVYRSGRSGKMLLMQADYTCNNVTLGGLPYGQLTIPQWDYTVAPYDSWNNAVFSAYSAYTNDQKKFVAEIYTPSERKVAQIKSVVYQGNTFTLFGLCPGPDGSTGKVDLYWTNDIPFDVGSPLTIKAASFILSQTADTKIRYGGSWQEPNRLWHKGTAADVTALTNYFAYYYGFTSPQPRGTWILEGGNLKLLRDE